MRSTKSRSRNKNRNNNRSVGNVMNRVFDSSGPEGKVRGTPQQIIDKYNQLAQDAHLSNDRVMVENFQQHAEHYQRLLAVAQREQEARREAQEREQRERQQQRAERREENATRSNEAETKPDGKPDAVQPVAGAGDQPDVIEPPKAEDNLVETPELADAKPPRARRPRKPRAEKTAPDSAPAPSGEGNPEAAE